jgi:hypothetical protein
MNCLLIYVVGVVWDDESKQLCRKAHTFMLPPETVGLKNRVLLSVLVRNCLKRTIKMQRHRNLSSDIFV